MKRLISRLIPQPLLLAVTLVLGSQLVDAVSADAAPMPRGRYRVEFDDSAPRRTGGYSAPQWRTGYSGYSRTQSLRTQNQYWLSGRVYRTYRDGQYYTAPRPSDNNYGGLIRRHSPYGR